VNGSEDTTTNSTIYTLIVVLLQHFKMRIKIECTNTNSSAEGNKQSIQNLHGETSWKTPLSRTKMKQNDVITLDTKKIHHCDVYRIELAHDNL
jgi:hypothetical protein